MFQSYLVLSCLDQQIRDYSVYDHIEADFWFQSCLKEKSPKVILAMIRLVMFQNSLVLAQFIFYLWQIDSEVQLYSRRSTRHRCAACFTFYFL